MQTPEEYYADENNHGGYQYVSFASLIEDLEEDALDPDSYLKNTKRSQFIKHAIKGIRNMNFNALNEIRALEIALPESLTVVLPPDYMDWVRLSVIGTKDRHLYALGQNKKMPTAQTYLRDNNDEILFDNNGDILKGSTDNSAFNQPFERRKIHRYEEESFDNYPDEFDYGRGNVKNVNTSEYNTNGEFKIDHERGAIAFSSDLATRSIMLEYVSDGLDFKNVWNKDIKVHKYIVDAVLDYVYWQVIRKKRNVTLTEKGVARHEYFNSRRLAKKRLGSGRANEILKAMTAATKWI